MQRLVTSTIRHRRRSQKNQVERRKKLSFEKRKAWFEKLTKKSAATQKAKAEITKKIERKNKGKSAKQPKPKPKAKAGK